MQIDTAGTYTLKYTAEDACGNVTEVTREVVAEAPPVYGVYWDGGSSPLWTRTDKAVGFADPIAAVANGDGSSPFDDIMPWSGMEIVEDAVAGTLVRIPKYWFKWTRNGASMKLQIANTAQNGFFVSPAHADRGDGNGERDFVYVGRYHCASDYKSKSGVQPQRNKPRNEFRQGIHSLGSDIWQYDFAMYWTIAMLYLVEYANWNTQETIGYGCGSGSLANEGSTDAMTYHTGTDATTRQTYGNVQYRHIEGLWSNIRDWCDGIYFSSRDTYCIKNPADFSDDTGGTWVGTRLSSGGYISEFFDPSAQGFEYALFPALSGGGTGDTYICDSYYYGSGGAVLHVGGGYFRVASQLYGLFYFDGGLTIGERNSYVGSRLQKLP